MCIYICIYIYVYIYIYMSMSICPYMFTIQYISIWIYIYIWRFPKIGIPPKSSIHSWISITNHPAIGVSHGVPILRNLHIYIIYIYIYITSVRIDQTPKLCRGALSHWELLPGAPLTWARGYLYSPICKTIKTWPFFWQSLGICPGKGHQHQAMRTMRNTSNGFKWVI